MDVCPHRQQTILRSFLVKHLCCSLARPRQKVIEDQKVQVLSMHLTAHTTRLTANVRKSKDSGPISSKKTRHSCLHTEENQEQHIELTPLEVLSCRGYSLYVFEDSDNCTCCPCCTICSAQSKATLYVGEVHGEKQRCFGRCTIRSVT